MRQGAGIVLACAVAIGAWPAAAHAEDANRHLRPASAWQVFYDNESCDLSRRFGEGQNSVTLFIQQFGPGDVFELRLVGAALGKPRPVRRAELRFGALEPIALTEPYLASTTEGNTVLLAGLQSLGGWDEAAEKARALTPAEEATISTVSFKVPGKPHTVLETGSVGKAMDAMRTCTDNLVAHWGYDPAVVRKLRSGPAPKSRPSGWIAASAYPVSKQREGQEAILRVRMNVAADGVAEDCAIQGRVGDPAFAKSACAALLRNAQFTPGSNADGKPVRAPWFTSVRFRMAGPGR